MPGDLNNPTPHRPLWQQVLALFAALAVCFAVAGLGSALTTPSLAPWYAGLAKPAWTPPNAVFPPVWSTLFALMAVAAWLVWRRAGLRGGAWPLGLFAVQLAFNLGWSALFFALQRPGPALLEIVVLWALIAATALAFRRVSPLAGWLLVPYLAWVGYAVALNAAIVWLNG